MNELYNMSKMLPGESAKIETIKNDCKIRDRLRDFGMIENTEVECVCASPLGGISAFCVRGAVIALRNEDSCKITLKKR